jgi:hypothetical protein
MLDRWQHLLQLVTLRGTYAHCVPVADCLQVPDRITVDRDDRNGPAGKLRGVHRDFLMMLLYYPYCSGYVVAVAAVLETTSWEY